MKVVSAANLRETYKIVNQDEYNVPLHCRSAGTLSSIPGEVGLCDSHRDSCDAAHDLDISPKVVLP